MSKYFFQKAPASKLAGLRFYKIFLVKIVKKLYVYNRLGEGGCFGFSVMLILYYIIVYMILLIYRRICNDITLCKISFNSNNKLIGRRRSPISLLLLPLYYCLYDFINV